MKYVVYAIIDPRSYEIFYIGETGNFTRRREQHIEGSNQISGLVIKQIKEAGFLPHFVILEHCPSEEDALHAEVAWQRHFKSIGTKLTNSQAFNGYAARQKEVQKQTKEIERMIRCKKDQKRLRHIANGRTYKSSENDQNNSHQKWSNLELARLKGMLRSNMSVSAIAKILGRSEGAIKSKMKDLKLKAA